MPDNILVKSMKIVPALVMARNIIRIYINRVQTYLNW
jgi:hypothetical protein